MAPTKPYSGILRRLVLAFDVGTTYSGIAYAVLDPGDVPKINAITRYPGQENSDFKIPSIMYYTQDGRVRAAGAEAAEPRMKLLAEDENLIFVEWFKLHLRPGSMAGELQTDSLRPLPPGKTAIDVFADFLKYLFSCARRYITQTHANGESLWESVDSRIDFIFGHPNGWEGLQQSKMRQAAVAAELIPNTPAGQARVHFVTEGEASLHYCLDGGLASDVIKAGSKVVIIDAGGGTVDLSTYTFTSVSPTSVEEAHTPDCILQGSTRVNARARSYLKEKLRDSKYGNDQDLDSMLDHFDKSTKPTFKDPQEKSFIKFGSMRDKDPTVGIRGGQLQLSGTEVERFFEPSVTAIIEAVRRQCDASNEVVPTAFLVGGFAASPWLFLKLQEALNTQGIQLCRPDLHTNKAVAEGAASFYLQQFVSTRVAKLTYGTKVAEAYNEFDAEHRKRSATVGMNAAGRKLVPGAFAVALAKGKRMRDNEEVAIELIMERGWLSAMNTIECDVTCYRGRLKDPRWLDNDKDMYSCLLNVRADISSAKKDLCVGPAGPFYRQHFKMILLCGLTELKAQISWMEDGVEKRGPAEIVYDDDALAA